jgi:hypothetical protein
VAVERPVNVISGPVRLLLVAALTITITLAGPVERAPQVAAAECTPRIGPSIPPPSSVPSGIPGLHAYWYGQSGYPTLCPGQTARAVVAFYNSGTQGWAIATDYTAVHLGTSGPEPGLNNASVLGGNSTHGTVQTRWVDYNRVAGQPVPWIGPNQVAWFQFTVKAPQTPGTYKLYLRPLIEGRLWLEDFGVYWQVTVIATSTTPTRVTIQSVEESAFTAGGTRYTYDRNDLFEYGDGTVTYDEFRAALSAGDVVDLRYEPSPAESSGFNLVDDPPKGAPTVLAQGGKFDSAAPTDDIKVTLTPPASAGAEPRTYNLQRALVPLGTAACTPTSGWYVNDTLVQSGSLYVDPDVPAGTYCYRATNSGMFGYSAPVRIPTGQ